MDLDFIDDEEYEIMISRKPKYLRNIWKTLLFLYSCIVQALTVALTLNDTSYSVVQDIYMFFMYMLACAILAVLMIYLHINRRQTFEEATKENTQTHKLAFSMCGEHVGLYLRSGLVLIGLFTLIYIILSNAQIMTYKPECINYGLLISSGPHCLFVVMQIIFILKYHSIIILRHKRLVQFGLFNIILVNIITWEISCLSKISYGGNVITNNPNCTIKSINGLNLYFLPAVAEYSVIGLAITFEIMKRIGKCSLIETSHEFGSSEFFEETKKSILGCIIGTLIVLSCIGYTVFIILSDNLYHYYWVFNAHCGEEITLYVLSIIILVIAFSKTQKLKFSFTFLQNNIDKNLLYISGFLSIVFSIMIATYCFTYLSDDKRIVRVTAAILEMFQICFQTIVIQDCFYRCSDSQEQHHKKPGQNLIAILIGLNFGLWIFKSFQLKNGDIFFNKYQNIAQSNTLYSFFLYVTLPLSVLYRYHSSCCFAGAFSKMYQVEIDRFEGMLRVEGFDNNDVNQGKKVTYRNQASLSIQSPALSPNQRSLTLPALANLFSEEESSRKEVPAKRRQTIINLNAAKMRILSSQLSHTMVNQKLSPTYSSDVTSSPKTPVDDPVTNCFDLLTRKKNKHARRLSSNPLDLSTSLNHLYASIPNSPNPLSGESENIVKILCTRSEENLNSGISDGNIQNKENTGL